VGTSPTSGSCTITYFGDLAPAPQTSVPIPAGSQLTFSLSQGNSALGITGAPGFQGYVIADCGFGLARGIAMISNPSYFLSLGVNPSGAGTMSGGGVFTPGSQTLVRATANANFTFAYFSGDVSGTTNPQVVTVDAPIKTVIGNFEQVAPVLTAAVSGKANGGAAGQRIWTIRLSNIGKGAATNTQISGVALSQASGTACSPAGSVITPLPVAIGTIAPATNATGQITLDFSGCPDSTARFTMQVSFSADGYIGSTTINNQTK
jgi:hypothetical protein